MVRSLDRIIIIVADGMSDLPSAELQNQTPIEFASTPTLDYLAKIGQSGYISILRDKKIPHSDVGHLAILGYSVDQARGVFEALGSSLVVQPGDICGRVNMGIVRDGLIVDRRGGGINTAQSSLLLRNLQHTKDGMFDVDIRMNANYRGAVILHHRKSVEVSNESVVIQGNDPKRTGVSVGRCHGSTEEEIVIAKALNNLIRKFVTEQQAVPVDQPNMLLIREIGRYQSLKEDDFYHRFGLQGTIISGVAVVRGVGKYLGLDILGHPRFTADYHSHLQLKMELAARCESPFVLINIKQTDYASHQKDMKKKIKAIERIDQAVQHLLTLINLEHTILVVTSDHTTSWKTGQHTGDPVACVIAGKGIVPDEITHFGESYSIKGALKLDSIHDLIPHVIKQLNL